MSKRRSSVTEDERPPQLLVPPEQLKSELQRRIELGNGLLDSLRSAINEALFQDARTQLRVWHDYNVGNHSGSRECQWFGT